MDIFCAFLWICSENSATFLFSSITTNIDNEIISYLAQISSFQPTFFKANDCENWRRGNDP